MHDLATIQRLNEEAVDREHSRREDLRRRDEATARILREYRNKPQEPL